MSEFLSFSLPDEFVDEYKNRQPDWGLLMGNGNSYSEIVFLSKYSKLKPDGTKEEWWETCRRCIEGYHSILKDWCKRNRTPWNEFKALSSAKDAYTRMFEFKWMPPGRGLEHMGTAFVHEEQNSAPLQNCGFLSSEKLSTHSAWEAVGPFVRMMEMSMYGIGIGFDVRGADSLTIHQPSDEKKEQYVIEDSREGWAQAVGKLLESYFFKNRSEISFDYSAIRPAGALLKRYGGQASGPEPLRVCIESIREQFNHREGEKITSRDIVDIMNKIGKAVQAGGSRRTAQICFGDPSDKDYVGIKDFNLSENFDRTGADGWAWTSNNSVFADVGKEYPELINKIKVNGEPGFMWLKLAQDYGRLIDAPNYLDKRIKGGNPCQPGWATIITPNGISTIDDISIGDQIWSETGWTTVTNKWSTGVKDVNRYRTTSGVFYGTDSHRLVSSGNKIEAQDAESIDQLVGPDFDSASLLFAAYDSEAIMDGVVIGDGTVHIASNDLVLLCIGKDDQDYFSSEIDYLIGRHRPGIGDYNWEIKTSITAEELPVLPIRTIPDRYIKADAMTQTSFLRGLYSANGSVVGQGRRVTLKSSCSELIEQVQIMLSRLGIASYYTTNKSKVVSFNNGDYECKESYDLNITRDREKFYNLIGFIQKYKMDKIVFGSNGQGKTNYDINSVDYISTEEVFDITVDNTTHTYWTGGVNVSNCLEQSLENAELCTLVETFPIKHESFEDYRETLKHAYLYGKAVTLMPTLWPETNEVMQRNRRIGTSMSGLAEFIELRGWTELRSWMDEGYKFIQHRDNKYSEWLAVRQSIKTTSIKPSGTVSLVANVTPGVHWPIASGTYIRRQRYAKHDPLLEIFKEANFHIEPDVNDPKNTLVVSFIIQGQNMRDQNNVSVWEKAELAAMAQRWWADNQVSATISFTEEEADSLDHLLASKDGQFKGISFLALDNESYQQKPYEPISDIKAEKIWSKTKKIDLQKLYHIGTEAQGDKFCENDSCLIQF